MWNLTNSFHIEKWLFPQEDPDMTFLPCMYLNNKKIVATFAGVAEVFPRILVVGALGRCGKGAIEMLLKMGIPKYVSLTPV